MRKFYTTIVLAVATLPALSQLDSVQKLGEVVVTGQYKPQSVKNSVYQVRVINNERIRLSGATTIQQVLNNQLGFRFSNDNTLGTTDVELMGMSGRNVKILLDGVPMIDRGDTRESLNQVDINSVDRIEIVEGPMSVSYGSDALAGVINIITKRNTKDNMSVTARVQEETSGTEYYPFSYKGSHSQYAGINWRKKRWNISAGGTHNDFDGFGGDAYGRHKDWLPKEQWLGNIKVGYTTDKFNIYYQLDGLDEDIKSRGPITQLYNAKDQHYLSDRFLHQLQGEFRLNNDLQLATVIAYTDYKRKTKTTIHDFQANTDRLSPDIGEQDVSTLNGFTFRNTLNYLISSKFSLQPGIDINREEASGERISGDKVITDYALFVSAEMRLNNWINIRPGLRFIKNSVYDAPPVIPSINTKFILNRQLDLRISYGYGFRAPALRELYFSFHDTNHNIDGNPGLEAEHSNSFNGSLNWTSSKKKEVVFSSRLSAFYNQFNNQILLVQSPVDSSLYSYFNVNRSKTAGGTLENSIAYKSFSATLGFSYIGFASSANNDPNFIKEDNRDFLWSPEINANITYNIDRINTKLGLFYKFTGIKPAFVSGKNIANQDIIYVGKTSSYNLADLTATTGINKYLSATIGIKNLFDVTNVKNTANSASIHSTDGPLLIGYGRSYFLGLSFQWHQ